LFGKRRKITRFGKFYNDFAGDKVLRSVGIRDTILRQPCEQGHDEKQQKQKSQSSTHWANLFLSGAFLTGDVSEGIKYPKSASLPNA
jgi:hypothetical protein